jgi:hypothetical protein
MSAKTSDPMAKRATGIALCSDERWVERAVRRLMPGGMRMTTPRSWRCGTEPSSPLSIDENITWLRKRKRTPKLRQDVREIVLCPYWYARFMTALAAVVATREASRSDEFRLRSADGWRELAKKASRIRRELADNFGADPPEGKIVFPEDRWTHYEAPLSITKAYEDVARSVSALSVIEQYGRFRRKILTNRQLDVWRLTFVTQLGLAWQILTGTRPSNSKAFLNFVAAAWESLTEDVELSWDWHVRRALELRQADWAGYAPCDDGGIRLSFESRSLPRKKKRKRAKR